MICFRVQMTFAYPVHWVTCLKHTRSDYEKMQSHLSTYMAWPWASWSIQRSSFMCDLLSMVYPQFQMISSSSDVIILFYSITKAKETHLSRDNHELYCYLRLQKYEVTDKYMIIATWQNVQGPDSIRRCHLTSIGNPIVEMRRSYDRLISTMGFPILVRWHLYIESGPWATYVVINHIKFHSSADFLNWHVEKPHHYSDVIMSAMASHINSVSSVCSTVFFRRGPRKIKDPRPWPLWGESNDDQWVSNVENVSIWRRHNVKQFGRRWKYLISREPNSNTMWKESNVHFCLVGV